MKFTLLLGVLGLVYMCEPVGPPRSDSGTSADAGPPATPDAHVDVPDAHVDDPDAYVAPDAGPACGTAHALAFAPTTTTTGAFPGPASDVTFALPPYVLHLCDATGDGHLDAVLGESDMTRSAAIVLPGAADGSLAPASTQVLFNYAYQWTVAAADVTNDGTCDAVTVTDTVGALFTSDFSLYPGFGSRTELASAPNNTIALRNQQQRAGQTVATDLNGDGLVDLAFGLAVAEGSQIGVFTQTSSGILGTGPTTYPITGYPGGIAAGDLNGDGAPDLVVSTWPAGGYDVLLADGHGAYLPAVHATDGAAALRIALADLDGDGHIDLTTAGSAGITLAIGNGDGTFATATVLSTDAASDVVVGDLDQDCALDIVETTGSNVVVLTGASHFSSMTTLPTSTSIAMAVALGDLDGDGMLDIVSTSSDRRFTSGMASIDVMLNRSH